MASTLRAHGPRVAHVRPLRCGGRRKTTGSGIHVRVPGQRRAKGNHRLRHSRACAGTAAGKGKPPVPAFTCVCRDSGGQRETTGTGIHVRVPGQRRAKGNHRNRHSRACAGTAPCLAHVGARHGEHPPGTWPAGRTCATPTVWRTKVNLRYRHSRACAGTAAGKGKPPAPAFTCVCRDSAMPGARRGSPWRAPSGHMARGSHMCDPYGVADEGKPPVPAFTCVCRDSGGQRETTGSGIHVRVPGQRHAWRT